MKKEIIIGTRGSKLALWQANFVKDALKDLGHTVHIQIIKTKGDQIQHLSFDKLEGKGFFTKELEDALLENEIDLAVHSLKDMPTVSVPNLVLGGLSYREDPADILLINPQQSDETKLLKLKQAAVVGTSSARRKSQIKSLRPDVTCKDIRGNVPTRIQKLKDGEADAILLAMAGINRLNINLDDLIAIPLHPNEFVPAPGQGVMAFQCREDDLDIRKILLQLHQEQVADCTNIERKVLQKMDGGCQLPLGVHCTKDANGFYHVIAAMQIGTELKKVKYSQSTVAGLADKVYDLLND